MVRLDLFPNAVPGIGDLYGNAVVVQPDGKVLVAGGTARGRSAVARYLADGQPDPDFNGGEVVTFFGAVPSLALLPDGRIMVAGTFAEDFRLVRLLPDGSPDPEFAGGLAIVDDVSGGDDTASCIALQADGKIVVTGRAVINGADSFITSRYLSTGVRDPDFANAGVAKVTLGGVQSQPRAMAIQQDGKILVTGFGGVGFALVRLNANGSPDSGFGASGRVVMPIGKTSGIGSAVEVEPEERILVAGVTAGVASGSLQGSGATNGTLWRFLPDGSLDAGFATGGIIKTSFPGYDSDFRAIQSDGEGRVLVTATFMPRLGSGFGSTSRMGVARYLAGGELDPDFGSGGYVAHGSGLMEIAAAMGVQRDGKIVVTGSRAAGTRYVLATRRFETNGVLTSFGGPGLTGAFTGFPGSSDSASAAAIAPDGKIVVAGSIWRGTRDGGTSIGHDFAVARWNPDGGLDPGFSGDGIQTRSISTGFSSDKALALAVQADGRILMAGSTATSRDSASTRGALVRFRADGSPDTSFGIGGLVNEATVPTVLAIQSNGRILAGSSTGSAIRIARYLAGGGLDVSFGAAGAATFPSAGGRAVAIVVQPDGRILAGVYHPTRSLLVRFTAAGTLDAGFGVGGEVVFKYAGDFNALNHLSLQSDGKIVACGAVQQSGTLKTILSRYHPDGTPDESFGTGGWVADHSQAVRNQATRVAVQPDGKIVTGGTLNTSEPDQRTVISRYLADGSPDNGFNGNGRLIYAERFVLADILLSANGAIVSAGTSYGTTEDDFAVDRFEAGPRIAVSEPPQADIAAGGSLDLGTVTVGSTGRLDLEIRNSGSSVLEVGALEVTGGDFSGTVTTPVALPVGGSMLVSLDFTPADSGVVSGTLRITSDAENEPAYQIALVGRGNLPPVFGGYAVSAGYQAAVLISGGKLLARASDPEGDGISIREVASPTAMGGSVSLQAGGLLYTPPAGFSGNDTFTVTLADAWSAESPGTITVVVGAAPAAGGATLNPPKLTPLPGGGMAIDFHGIPGRTYGIQRSTDMSLWVTLDSVTADRAGAVRFTDPAPPRPAAYYRLTLP